MMSLTDQTPHAPGVSNDASGKPFRVWSTVCWPYFRISTAFIECSFLILRLNLLFRLFLLLFLQFFWANGRIYLSADANNDAGEGFNVIEGGAEIHDTGTQYECVSNYGIGEEDFSTLLQSSQ